jgi:MarR family transcriptional regulator, organic hydroperoxide resistance regulator
MHQTSSRLDSFESLKLGNQLCFAVYAAAHAFTGAYKPLLDPLGLTYPQYLVLLVLWEEEGLSVKEIGQQLHLDSGTLTPVLKRLEKAGFVRRRRDAQDERQVRVELTDKGWDTRTKALEVPRSMICALGQPEPELRELKRAVDQLQAALRSGSKIAA